MGRPLTAPSPVSVRRGPRRIRLPIAATALLLALLMNGLNPAQATLPGTNGRIAFADFGSDGFADLFTIDPDGTNVINVTDTAGMDANPAWSPDGSKIAFTSDRDGDPDIYVMNADGSDPVNVTDASSSFDSSPSWSPDGTEIAFGRAGAGIVVIDAVTGAVRRTLAGPHIDPDWGPDGRIALSTVFGSNTELQVVNADLTGLTRLTITPRRERGPSWSPDGSRIAFTASESGTSAIWVFDADGSNPVELASGSGASWSPDGTRIAYGFGALAGLMTMNADGSDEVAVHGGFGSQIDERPAWGTALTLPLSQPDGTIALGAGAPIGEDVYNGTGVRQTVSTSIRQGRSKTFTVRIGNDGSLPDTITVLGPGSTKAFRVTYVEITDGSLDVTDAVVAGTYTTEGLAPGAIVTLRMRVTVTAKADDGDLVSFKITATSQGELSVRDAVRAKVRVS